MGYLFFSILASTLILITFRYFERFKINSFNAIILNYFAASVLGFLLANKEGSYQDSGVNDWFMMAVIIGVMFAIMFNVVSATTRKAGLTIASISAKMSVVIPMIFSILYYHESSTFLKIAGIVLAPAALLLTMIKTDIHPGLKKYIWLPAIMFIGMGITDSMVKFTQQDFLKEGNVFLFSAYLFVISFSVSFLTKLLFKSKFGKETSTKDILGGIILGLFNSGSLFFFIQALSYSGLDSSLVFAINSIGIVLLSVLAGIVLFKEKLNPVNWAGIILAIVILFILFQV
ncbi:MAG: EamA family transporter [Bacteroidales bacterium]|nr:EamA family transporter [Bacteroidales bacterium]